MIQRASSRSRVPTTRRSSTSRLSATRTPCCSRVSRPTAASRSWTCSFRPALAGSIEVRLRDLPPVRLEAGDSANIPANAPHAFRNTADAPARLLCTVAPAGLERFFAEFGDPVPTRTAPAPELSDVERRNRLERAAAKAPEYGIEMLAPGPG